MEKPQRVIKTQEELDALREEEHGMFYISLSGSVATFNGTYRIGLIPALDRLAQIAAGQSQYISDCFVDKKVDEAKEAMDVSLQTFLIPYRMH